MNLTQFLLLGQFEPIPDLEEFIRNFSAKVHEQLFGSFSNEKNEKKKQMNERKKLMALYRRRDEFSSETFETLDVRTCSLDLLIDQLGFDIVRLGMFYYFVMILESEF